MNSLPLPVLPGSETETEKQCKSCGLYHDLVLARLHGLKQYGFIWWNCQCNNTLVEKDEEGSDG